MDLSQADHPPAAQPSPLSQAVSFSTPFGLDSARGCCHGRPRPALRQLRQPGSPAPCASPDPRTATPGDWRPAYHRGRPCRSSTVPGPGCCQTGLPMRGFYLHSPRGSPNCRWLPLPTGEGTSKPLPEGAHQSTCLLAPPEGPSKRLPARLGRYQNHQPCLRAPQGGNFVPSSQQL